MKESSKKVLDMYANAVTYGQRIIKKCRKSENPKETFASMKSSFEANARKAREVAETRRAKEVAEEIVEMTEKQIAEAAAYISRIGIEVA